MNVRPRRSSVFRSRRQWPAPLHRSSLSARGISGHRSTFLLRLALATPPTKFLACHAPWSLLLGQVFALHSSRGKQSPSASASISHSCASPVRLAGSSQSVRCWRFAPACCAAQSVCRSCPPKCLSPRLASATPSKARRSAFVPFARPQARPNTSVNARPNGGAPGPRSALAYHAPHGPGTPPLAPRYLER